ncbi:hypothetical protein LCGC14_2881610 [marine sediment metagenome]|uniref:Uncharacterized protein n=1 Tax=marine sediment metagenome TaxID=412755 RepID=A0A0F8XZX2_9ZZZZ
MKLSPILGSRETGEWCGLASLMTTPDFYDDNANLVNRAVFRGLSEAVVAVGREGGGWVIDAAVGCV